MSLAFADCLPAPLISADHDDKAWQAELTLLRTQAEQRGFKQGQQQGYRQGFNKGRSDGFEQGLQDAQAEQEHITVQLADFLRELKATLVGVDTVMPARLMQIALTAAGKILGQSPVCDTRVVLSTIQQLLHDRPLFDGCLRLYVHPDDLPSLQRHLGSTLESQGWRLLADGQLLPDRRRRRRSGCHTGNPLAATVPDAQGGPCRMTVQLERWFNAMVRQERLTQSCRTAIITGA